MLVRKKNGRRKVSKKKISKNILKIDNSEIKRESDPRTWIKDSLTDKSVLGFTSPDIDIHQPLKVGLSKAELIRYF